MLLIQNKNNQGGIFLKIKNKLNVGLALALSLGALSPLQSVHAAPAKPTASVKAVTPTVFVHGFLGDDSTMSGLLEGVTGFKSSKKKSVNIKGKSYKLGYDGQEKTYVVDKSMGVHEYSFTDGKYKRGLVKVIFIDDKRSLTYNTIFLDNALKEIGKDYKTSQVNIVGHSMGGVTAANYAFDIYNRKVLVPSFKAVDVKKLMTIGSPFKGSRASVGNGKDGEIGELLIQNLGNNGGEVNKRFGAKNMKFSPNLKVVSLASSSDIFVPESSAYGLGSYIKVKGNLKKVKTTGSHFSMKTAPTTIKEVKSFIK